MSDFKGTTSKGSKRNPDPDALLEQEQLIDWESTDFSGSDNSATPTDTRNMLTQALKDGDMEMAKFYEGKLRKQTHAFGKE